MMNLWRAMICRVMAKATSLFMRVLIPGLKAGVNRVVAVRTVGALFVSGLSLMRLVSTIANSHGNSDVLALTGARINPAL